MNFGSKSFRPRAPDKGSFPLDHFGEWLTKWKNEVNYSDGLKMRNFIWNQIKP